MEQRVLIFLPADAAHHHENVMCVMLASLLQGRFDIFGDVRF
jgi:hypothetical protein